MQLTVKKWKDKAFLNGEFKALREIALKLPGYKRFLNDSLLFEPTLKNIEIIIDNPLVEWQGEAKEFIEDYNSQFRKEIDLSAEKHQTFSFDDCKFEFKTKPMEHQLRAFMLSKDQEYYGYFMEMGTGKTKVAIDNAAYLYQEGKINSLIIIAPNGVHSQWIREQIPEHLPSNIKFKSEYYRSSYKYCIRNIESIINDKSSDMKILAFNVDCFSSDKMTKFIQDALMKTKSMLVIDESTRIKTPGSKRTKNALKLSPLSKYRRIMSGAPLTKGIEDLYSQFKFLSPKILGFDSFYTFRNYFCIMGGFEGRQIVGYRPAAQKELERKVDAYTFRVTKKECLDLPEKVYCIREVELSDIQEKYYNNIKDELKIELEKVSENQNPKEINTALMSAVTKMMRMQQVVCGHFTDDTDPDNKQVIDLGNNRVDALMGCINEARGKIIVWSRFIYDLKKISRRLNDEKIIHRTYHGEVSGKDRESAIDSFRNDPACKVFLAQPASGGTGLNLAVADTVIYFSNDFNADTRWQSEDRAHRIGQKNNVTYIDLVTPGTIDGKILRSLRDKKNVADSVLDNPRFLTE